jgi:hypothetical protein
MSQLGGVVALKAVQQTSFVFVIIVVSSLRQATKLFF